MPIFMTDLIGVFALIIGLELVLGVDNILVITILVSRLEKKYQQKARIIGLVLAMVARILLLFLLLQLPSQILRTQMRISLKHF